MKHCLVILSLLLAASYVKAQTTTQPLMKYQNKICLFIKIEYDLNN